MVQRHWHPVWCCYRHLSELAEDQPWEPQGLSGLSGFCKKKKRWRFIDRVAINCAKFLSLHTSEELKWSNHADTMVHKARQRLFNLRMLKKFSLSPRALTVSYRSTIESLLSGCVTAGYGNSTAAGATEGGTRSRMHRWVHTACVAGRTRSSGTRATPCSPHFLH